MKSSAELNVGGQATGLDASSLTPLEKAPGRMIEGVRIRRLSCHEDERGSFMEVDSEDWEDRTFKPAQWSIVRSNPGTLRGMHLHRRHDECFSLVQGCAWVGLHDIRPGSPTEGVAILIEANADIPTVINFPRGIVHGWYFPDQAVHLQAVSETFGGYRGDDNLGCHWSDPDLDITWPETPRIVSARAEGFGTLRELRDETLRRDPGFGYTQGTG